MFGEGILLLVESLIWKKRIIRETLLHFTNRYEYKFAIKAGTRREEKTMKMNTHR